MWTLLAAAAYVAFIWPAIRAYSLLLLVGVFMLAIVVLVRRKVLQGAGALLLAIALSLFVLVDMFMPKVAPSTMAPIRSRATAPSLVETPSGKMPAQGETVEEVAMPPPQSVAVTRPAATAPAPRGEKEPVAVASIPRMVPRIRPKVTPQALLRPEGPQTFPFRLYGDCDDGMFPYYPYGWMGNIDAIDLNECWEENPHSGSTCMRFEYNAVGRWAGVAWQDPANNWGDVPGGYNLTGAKKLTFWVRGETGFERAEFKVGLLGIGKKYNDTAKRTLGKVQLYKEWHQYTISVEGMNMGRMITAFLWIVEGGPRPVVFYIDDIQYE